MANATAKPADATVQPQPKSDIPPGMVRGVAGKPIEDGERDPDTIAEEQRRRSDEIAKTGVQKWIDDHDERPPNERTNRQVPGVAPPASKESRK